MRPVLLNNKKNTLKQAIFSKDWIIVGEWQNWREAMKGDAT